MCLKITGQWPVIFCLSILKEALINRSCTNQSFYKLTIHMTKLVAITGATGFIGQTICKQLVNADYQVRALVRSESRAAGLLQSGVELCKLFCRMRYAVTGIRA